MNVYDLHVAFNVEILLTDNQQPLFFVGDQQSVNVLAMTDSGGNIRETMKAWKAIRRRHGRAKQQSTSSSSPPPADAAAGSWTGKTKNAAMILNELQPGGLKYDQVTKSGPDHKPLYTANITVHGQV